MDFGSRIHETEAPKHACLSDSLRGHPATWGGQVGGQGLGLTDMPLLLCWGQTGEEFRAGEACFCFTGTACRVNEVTGGTGVLSAADRGACPSPLSFSVTVDRALPLLTPALASLSSSLVGAPTGGVGQPPFSRGGRLSGQPSASEGFLCVLAAGLVTRRKPLSGCALGRRPGWRMVWNAGQQDCRGYKQGL